jgi:hypothetical protein
MAHPINVLLPKVFPNDLISLGQLLRNPLVPNINAYRKGCSKIIDADISVPDIESPYKTIVSTGARGHFDIGLTKLLGAKINARSTNLLSIEADKLEYTTLKDSSEIFKRICDDDETKKWIADMVLNKAPCYFVIGLQKLHNATFKRAILKSGGGDGYVSVPLETTAQIPLHIEGGIAGDKFGNSGATVNGIFGIQVQKLQSKIAPSGEPQLKSDVSWHWSYQRVKGTQKEEDKVLYIDLEDVELEELLDLLKQDEEEEDKDDNDNEDRGIIPIS